MALTVQVQTQLRTISPATIDRRLRGRGQLKKRLYGRTKPGTLLKHHIPIKTDNWDVKTPGFTEIDLLHSATGAQGAFATAQRHRHPHHRGGKPRGDGKSQIGVLNAMHDIERALPFKLLGIDSGQRFGIYQLPSQDFLRSEPYPAHPRPASQKKDDNAHIEQRTIPTCANFGRPLPYDGAQKAINELYQNELRIFQNLFLPADEAEQENPDRLQAQRRRDYKPQTPLERVLQCPQVDPEPPTAQRLRDQTDPLSWPNASTNGYSNRLANQREPQPKPTIAHPRLAVKADSGEIAKIFGPQLQK